MRKISRQQVNSNHGTIRSWKIDTIRFNIRIQVCDTTSFLSLYIVLYVQIVKLRVDFPGRKRRIVVFYIFKIMIIIRKFYFGYKL